MSGRGKRWLVRKLDGAWQAFDSDGNLRYAGADWFEVYAFARLVVGRGRG